MAHLASGILEVWRLLGADKTAGFPVSGSVAWITFFDLLRGKMPYSFFNTIEGGTFFRICHEVGIFFRVTFFACEGADIYGEAVRGAGLGVSIISPKKKKHG